MGRYAFFNTGVEYKFVFAVQNSGDILEFGGWFNNSTNDPVVRWSAAESAAPILEKLRGIEKDMGISEMDFTAFPATEEGTYMMRCSVEEAHECGGGDLFILYRLGCII